MPGTLCLRFSGPYSWSGCADAPSVFDSHEAQHRGVYLRTVARPEGHLIYDVGQSRPISHCVGEFPRLAHAIHGLTNVYRFLLAPLDASSRLRERAVAAIAAALHGHDGHVRSFQEIGVPPPRRRMHEPPLHCRISTTVPLQGLPEQLTI